MVDKPLNHETKTESRWQKNNSLIYAGYENILFTFKTANWILQLNLGK